MEGISKNYLVKISGIDGSILKVGTEETHNFEKWVNLFMNHRDFIKTLFRIDGYYRYDFYFESSEKPFKTYYAL